MSTGKYEIIHDNQEIGFFLSFKKYIELPLVLSLIQLLMIQNDSGTYFKFSKCYQKEKDHAIKR